MVRHSLCFPFTARDSAMPCHLALPRGKETPAVERRKTKRGQGLTTAVDPPPVGSCPVRLLGGFAALRQRLSSRTTLSGFQTFIGLTTGVLSIAGALFALPSFFRTPPPEAHMGQIVAIWKRRRQRRLSR